jgi:hypothetical protein
MPDITANSSIGLILVWEIELKMNWLEIFAVEPTNDAIPNPIPLKGKGNISVMYKKKTEK